MPGSPFKLLLETVFDEQSRQVSLRVSVRNIESNEALTISSNKIIQLLSQRGYGRYFVFDEMIPKVVEDINERLTLQQNIGNLENFSIETQPIAEARDAHATVEVSKDASQATLTITPARGGNHIEKQDALTLIANSGVMHGIDELALEKLLVAAKTTEENTPLTEVIAFAAPPIKGDDSQFIPLVETANERILKPKLRADGTIDMRELGDLPLVIANQLVMRKKHFTNGVPGIDVLGNLIPAEPGKDFDFKMADGIGINPKNPDELIAVIKGQPNLIDRGMRVDPVVKVKAVDLSTGNIDIDANLLVDGDITECMVVKCTGNITVGGVIESAHVEAGGSILVGKGIVGHVQHQDPKASKLTTQVIAGDRIDAVFASYSSLEAANEVHLDEQLLHCNTISHGRVTVGNSKTVGSQIVGGVVHAEISVETDVLGSSVGVPTHIDLSASYHGKQEELKLFEKGLAEKNQQLADLRTLYSKLTGMQLTPERQEKATKLKNTILHLSETIKKDEVSRSQFIKSRDDVLSSMHVIAKRRLHPSVEIKIGPKTFHSKRAMESGIISYCDGEVVYKPQSF